jgi:outer membrane protein assembly factor BamB
MEMVPSMQSLKATAAILCSMSLGMLASTYFSGCAPAGPPPVARGGSLNTNSLNTNSAADRTEAPPADDATDKPAVAANETEPAKESAIKPGDEPAAKPANTVAETDKPAEQVADASGAKPAPAKGSAAQDVEPLKPDRWIQWGGNGHRNNVPVVENPPLEWNPGEFDRKTGDWISDDAKNIKWVAALGSQAYGNTIVGSGKVILGTNNSHGYLKRYPADIDLGCLLCFNEKDGKLLWQHSSEKLPTGRVHDWPLMGVCCSALIEGDRVWFVTNRGEVRCLDADGYYDGEDDGPVKNDIGRLFDIMRADEGETDKVGPGVAALEKGKLTDDLRQAFAAAGAELPAEVTIKADDKAKPPLKKWTFQAEVNGKPRDFFVTLAGAKLSAFKTITVDDKDEADVIWVFDMMKELGTSQHNMCSCSVTTLGDILFVNTSNGVDEAHIAPPAPEAASFLAMDKNTGKVLWTDNSPGGNILHGQWGSPAVGLIGGVSQVVFGGGDGWMYAFRADKGKDGKPEFLWKFDANAKDAVLELGGRGTRNDIISTPVIYNDRVYFCTGQDPEHGEGAGTLWCIDPTKRGDISEELAVNRADPKTSLPVKRVQAVVEAEGDIAIKNPNSGVVWKFAQDDANGDGKFDFEEVFHRSICTVAIKNDLLFVPDFSGLLHVVDAKTGKQLWTADMLAAAWGSPMIAGDYVYVGDEDGDISIFKLSREPQEPVAEINMLNSVYSTPIMAGGVLYIGNKDHIFAIEKDAKPATSKAAASGE